MNPAIKKILFWTPRVLCILFAAFMSLFALDVFGHGYGFWKTALAFVMHEVPVLMLLAILVVCWRWEWIGAALFPALGALYIISAWGRFPLSVYFIVAGPLFLLGVMFLVNWRYRAELRSRN